MSIYDSLDQTRNQFRLFRIRKSSRYADPIVGDLEYHDLSQPPEFHAVSYFCGGPVQDSFVWVNGYQLKVVKNCEVVLQEIRATNIPLVWIDQICIDQETRDEKAAQILRIAYVYRAAKTVITWLGPHDNASSRLLRQIGTGARTELSLQDITALFQRPYWQRAWIVQEMAVATELQIWCGDSFVGWDVIERLLDKLLYHKVGANVKYDSLRYQTLLDLYQNGISEQAELYCLRYVRDARTESHALSLLQLLQLFHRSLAGDMRDKVYALLGLAWDRGDFVTEPSYSNELTVPRLCLDMTQANIARKRSLDVIFFAGVSSRQSRLPTWCPDYICLSGDPIATNLATYLTNQEARFRLGAEGYRWKTTSPSVATSDTFSISGERLTVHAYQIDSIVGLGKLPQDERDHQHDDRQLARPEMLELMRSMAAAMHMYDKNYAKYPIMPQQPFALYSGPQIRLQDFRPKMAGQSEVVKEWRERNRDFRIGGKTIGDLGKLMGQQQLDIFVDPKSYGHMWQGMKRWGRSVVNSDISFTAMMNMESLTIGLAAMFREGMRLAVTAPGNKMGWAHPNAQVGDQVFLLAGCSMPAILRRDDLLSSASRTNGGVYRLVGYGYFDGMMDGQLWNRMSANNNGTKNWVDII